MPYYHAVLPIKKTIRLPEYDYIGITELEEKIIDTPYFQRLRRIRQSPGVSLVYPGASHTRFEHCLGTMEIAGESIIHILLNSKYEGGIAPSIIVFKKIKKNEFARLVQIARLGGLLHDIGHGPLSHTFEMFLNLSGIEWSHEDLSMEIIYKKLKPCFNKNKSNPFKVDVREVLSLLCDYGPYKKKIILSEGAKQTLKKIGLKNTDFTFIEKFLTKHWYLNQIIQGEPYNADRFNYLILDSNRTGAVEYGKIDVQRILQNLTIAQNRITLFSKAKDAAVRFFEAYAHMYRSVYLHKTANGGDLHLALCMVKAAKTNSFFKKLASSKPKIDDILKLYDDVIYHELAKTKPKKQDKRLIEDFLNRRILTTAYSTEDPKFLEVIKQRGGKEKFLNEIKKNKGLPKNTVIEIRHVTEKKAAIGPPSYTTLRRLGFLNLTTGSIEHLPEDVLPALTMKKLYRVYTIKDKKIEQKIESAIKSLLR